jgi:hypothetical protein
VNLLNAAPGAVYIAVLLGAIVYMNRERLPRQTSPALWIELVRHGWEKRIPKVHIYFDVEWR